MHSATVTEKLKKQKNTVLVKSGGKLSINDLIAIKPWKELGITENYKNLSAGGWLILPNTPCPFFSH